MDKYVEISILLDIYGEFLTDKQYKITEFYYNNNYSLGEISEMLNISRQGVHDTLKRSEKILYEFDSKLNLKDKFQRNHNILTNILTNIESIKKGKSLDNNETEILNQVIFQLEKLIELL